LATMIEVKYRFSANIDKINAKNIITKYFMQWNNPNKTTEQINVFNKELRIQVTNLKRNPKMYPVRYEVVFDGNVIPIRYFNVHWFTVFYSYDDSLVTIWFIRSSKSDFSKFASRTS
jgi:plasmid stabilization system protein ParE